MIRQLGQDALSQYSLDENDISVRFITPFVEETDQNLLLALQELLHTRPATISLREIPVLCDMIEEHIQKSDLLLTGVAKTNLIQANIEKTEFELFSQKLAAVIKTVDVFFRKLRIHPLVPVGVSPRPRSPHMFVWVGWPLNGNLSPPRPWPTFCALPTHFGLAAEATHVEIFNCMASAELTHL